MNQFEVEAKDDVLILFDENYEDAAGNERDGEISFLTSRTRERMEIHDTERQLKGQNITIGLHHGKLKALPGTWKPPKGLQMISLINM